MKILPVTFKTWRLLATCLIFKPPPSWTAAGGPGLKKWCEGERAPTLRSSPSQPGSVSHGLWSSTLMLLHHMRSVCLLAFFALLSLHFALKFDHHVWNRRGFQFGGMCILSYASCSSNRDERWWSLDGCSFPASLFVYLNLTSIDFWQGQVTTVILHIFLYLFAMWSQPWDQDEML